MRLLVTRPDEDAPPLMAALKALGHEALHVPLLAIRPLPEAAIPLEPWQALLVTSANGVRALAAHGAFHRLRDLSVFAVGEASAQAARDAGFLNVRAAGGDVASLNDLVRIEARREDGPLLHIGGAQVAGDLKGGLEAAGFRVTRAVIYEVLVPDAMPDRVVEALEGGAEGILFYSPRTAETFAALYAALSEKPSLHKVAAYCLSEAVAGKLESLEFQALKVAPVPQQAALLALIGRT